MPHKMIDAMETLDAKFHVKSLHKTEITNSATKRGNCSGADTRFV